MCEKICPGLPADWLNGWLAAVGITVLSSRIRLSWSEGATPCAVLTSDSADPVKVLLEDWPSQQRLDDMPIVENWYGCEPMKRKVPYEIFVERAHVARARCHRDAWTLSSTMTDLQVDKKGEVAHAPLDPAGPGTIKWLHYRLCKSYKDIRDIPAMVTDTLEGSATRVKGNGLGFDYSRVTGLADKTDPWVHPVIEVLVFFGLSLLPVRGMGIDQRMKGAITRSSVRQRCWYDDESKPGSRAKKMYWPAWSQPLTVEGIDALLDLWTPLRNSRKRARWRALGVHSGWKSVEYQPRGAGDRTRGFGSTPL